jgi:hypothetical protein
MRLAYALHDAGFVVSVVNPVQAHRLAQAQLRRAKTEAIDARFLMELGFKLEPSPGTPPPPLYAALYQRLRQRNAWLEIRTQERNRLHALRQWPDAQGSVVARYHLHIAFLTEQSMPSRLKLSSSSARTPSGRRPRPPCSASPVSVRLPPPG